MADDPEKVISEIFDADGGYSSLDHDVLITSLSYSKLREFALMLAESPPEERMQKFLKEDPRILMGLYGWGDDSVLAFLTKPPIGNSYRADFGVLQYGQGGCFVHLIEIEPCGERLFTKAGDRAKRHNGALTQVRDWKGWVESNKQTFVKDLMTSVRGLPRYPDRAENGSFRRQDYDLIERSWRGFGGFEYPVIDYTIVIGRWAKLSSKEKKDLILQNQYDDKLAKVITYDQLARMAFERPFRKV